MFYIYICTYMQLTIYVHTNMHKYVYCVCVQLCMYVCNICMYVQVVYMYVQVGLINPRLLFCLPLLLNAAHTHIHSYVYVQGLPVNRCLLSHAEVIVKQHGEFRKIKRENLRRCV